MINNTEEGLDFLLQTIKGSCVENYGVRGREWNGDKTLEQNYIRAMDLANLEAGQVVTVETANPSEIALCMVVKGKRVDKFDRSGSLGAIFITSPFEAKSLNTEIANTPDIVYEIIAKMNDGPIKRFDGTPCEMIIPQAIEILPTIATADNRVSYRNKLPQKTTSVPFPSGYKPW